MSIATLLLLSLLPASDLHGTVRAEGAATPLPGATVQVVELKRTATTDERGYFVIRGVEPGRWTVRAAALGYRPHAVVVQASGAGSVRLDFDLQPEAVRLDPVEVRGREGSTPVAGAASSGPGETRLDGRAVRLTPALAEADVLRAVQSLPSVAAISDFSSAPYVRGGSPDQSMVTLDGIPLYNPYHLGGLFGAIDPDAVQSVGVLAGAFPAGVGDRISSVLEIRTREAERDSVRATGAVGLISSRFGVGGPTPWAGGSYLFSGRHTYLDLATRGAEALGVIPASLPYGFSDAHLKLDQDLGGLARLSFSGYVNDESLVHRPEGEKDLIDFDWGSEAVGLRLWRPFGARLSGELRAAYSAFGGRFNAIERRWDPERQQYTDSTSTVVHASTGVQNAIVGAGLTWYGRRHQLRAGAQLDAYRFRHRVAPNDFVDEVDDFVPLFDSDHRPATLAVYLEDEWKPSDALSLRAGFRVMAAGERGTAWMPRLGLRYAPTSSTALWAGAGRSAQVMHSLHDAESVSTSIVAYDILAAVPEAQGLTVADDLVLGGEWRRADLTLRVEAYEKRFRSVPVTPIPDDPLGQGLVVPEEFREGTGTSRGLEVLAQYARGGAGLNAAYTLAKAEREVDGARFTPRFDRRHTLDLNGFAPLGSRGQVSARLVFASGQPYTPVVGVMAPHVFLPEAGGFVENGNGVLVMGEHNTARLPGYARLDLGARRSFQRRWFGRPTTFTPYLQVLNVLNTRNVLFAFPERGYEDSAGGGPSTRLRLQHAPQLPVFPTFGVEWRF
ncbi:MAG TPA: TonB-dependent receptor [Longimicrobiaceae bacterium]|nr:TonB-dependent receptor [Longimicrobiaceae bacterium]